MKLTQMAEAFKQFALKCSGANLNILREDECVSEQSKYAMIGVFVFLTSIFASLSGGYALYKGFKSAWLAIPIGLLWGGFIFNVDRFIVSTMRNKQLVSDLSLSERLSYWGGVALRILLALLI